MKVVIIGGTGLIGAKLVTLLQRRGHEAIAASPNTGVDALTGRGLDTALEGASVLVDVTNTRSFADDAVLHFFSSSTRHLVDAARAAGVAHYVALSVVGTDRLQQSGYFRAKIAQERLVAESAIPYTIVRATQFFEFVEGIAAASTVDNVVRLPPMPFQPMAADDVAGAMADIAVGAPANGIVELAGPEPFRLDELARTILAARQDQREVIGDPAASYFGAALDSRTLLPGEGARLGETSLDVWMKPSYA